MIHPVILEAIHSFSQSFIHPSMTPFIQSFSHPIIRPAVHSFIFFLSQGVLLSIDLHHGSKVERAQGCYADTLVVDIFLDCDTCAFIGNPSLVQRTDLWQFNQMLLCPGKRNSRWQWKVRWQMRNTYLCKIPYFLQSGLHFRWR